MGGGVVGEHVPDVRRCVGRVTRERDEGDRQRRAPLEDGVGEEAGRLGEPDDVVEQRRGWGAQALREDAGHLTRDAPADLLDVRAVGRGRDRARRGREHRSTIHGVKRRSAPR